MRTKYLCYLSSMWVGVWVSSIFKFGWETWVICIPICVMNGVLLSHIERIEGERSDHAKST